MKSFTLVRSSLSLAAVITVVSAATITLASHRTHAQTAPAGPGVTGSAADEIAALKSEIAILRGRMPDQSHVMKDVAYHFTNLWFAGQNRNWPLAKFYCDETRAHLKWAVRVIPVRKIKGGELDLRPMLDGLDQSLFLPLSKTVDSGDSAGFEQAYRQAMDGCISCHVAAEKPFLRLKIPAQPEVQIIDFVPAH